MPALWIKEVGWMIDDKYDRYIVIPLASIFIIVVLSVSAFPTVVDAAREAEVKSNCHEIQLALESYAIDHDGTYPAYLFGGDKDGWDPESELGCQVMKGHHKKLPPTDPLIDGGYLASYPRNPFINPGKGAATTIFWTGGTSKLGWGDPRFGYDGEIMGNCLNDPLNLYTGSYGTTEFANTMPGSACNFIGMVQGQTPVNPFYSMGGIPMWSHETMGSTGEGWLNVFWPGQFFYRACGPSLYTEPPRAYTEFYSGEAKSKTQEKGYKIWDFKPAFFDRYLLGGYGSTRTKGIDCIRLTMQDGKTANNIRGYLGEFYEIHPDYGWNVHLSTPEVFGGGEKGVLPTFPYYDENGEWVYGAPDGYPDGIIILLTPGGVYDDFTEKIADQTD